MFKKPVIIVACLTTLNAYSDTLPIPQPDEQRRYQLQTSTEVEMTSRNYGSSSESVRSTLLMDYQLSEQDDTYELLAIPQYMFMDSRAGEISSLGSLESDGADTMAEGVTFILDKESGVPLDMIFNHPPKNLLGLASLRESMTSLFVRPNLGSGIVLEEGASLDLEAEAPLPAMQVTVVDLNDERVTLRVRGESDEARIFGYLNVERDSGWPVDATLALEVPFEQPGSSGELHSMVMMRPADGGQSLGLDMMQYYQERSFDYDELPEDYSLPGLPSEEQVFAQASGQLDYDSYNLRIEYEHQLYADDGELGSMEVSDINAINDRNQALDKLFQAQASESYRELEDGPVITHIDILPLGWDWSEEDVDEVAGIEATLSWYGYDIENLSLPLPLDQAPGAQVEAEHAGARAVLTKKDAPGAYVLALYPDADSQFSFVIEGAESGVVTFPGDDQAPAWLSTEEARLVNVARHGSLPSEVALNVDEDARQLRVPLIVRHNTPSAQRRISFYDKQYRLDNLSEPADITALYSAYRDRSGNGITPEIAELETLTPQAFGAPQLYLTLSREQDRLCEPLPPENLEIQGHALGWQRYQPAGDGPLVMARLQLPREVVYQLVSDDGEQTHFYQEEVDVGLQCEGQPQWQPVDIDMNERNWLVDVADLLGDNWQEHPLASQPLAEFFTHYRFIDAQGQALAPGLPSSDANLLSLARHSLADFVTQQGQLRINGYIDHIEQLHVVGEPITRDWHHRFPQVPAYDETLYRPLEDL